MWASSRPLPNLWGRAYNTGAASRDNCFPEMCKKGEPTPAPYPFIAALVDKTLEHGYFEEDCGKVVGRNAYRPFKLVWK